jgi:hypothetical protein
MRHMGGCTECFTVWWGCRCPLRCEECGAGYRDDGNSNCGTPGCRAGQRRHWAMVDRWEGAFEARPAVTQPEPSTPAVHCEAVEPGAKAVLPAEGCPTWAPLAPKVRRRSGAQNGQVRKPDARSAARPSARPDKATHRPVADRRAAVEALLGEGLSDREIARRVGVSPSTVSAVRKASDADLVAGMPATRNAAEP